MADQKTKDRFNQKTTFLKQALYRISNRRDKKLHVYVNVDGFITDLKETAMFLWEMITIFSKESPDLAELIPPGIGQKMTWLTEGYTFSQMGEYDD